MKHINNAIYFIQFLIGSFVCRSRTKKNRNKKIFWSRNGDEITPTVVEKLTTLTCQYGKPHKRTVSSQNEVCVNAITKLFSVYQSYVRRDGIP